MELRPPPLLFADLIIAMLQLYKDMSKIDTHEENRHTKKIHTYEQNKRINVNQTLMFRSSKLFTHTNKTYEQTHKLIIIFQLYTHMNKT